tara:strand:+ start:158 stop:337 length:180 start_codon:yes stop_codon:yes gene_type:complete
MLVGKVPFRLFVSKEIKIRFVSKNKSFGRGPTKRLLSAKNIDGIKTKESKEMKLEKKKS